MISGTRLDGVALVFGGASGIGREAVFSLAEAGAKAMVIADLNEGSAKVAAEESKQFASNPDFKTATFKVDVQVLGEVEAAVDFVTTEFGRVDYAVNSAGVIGGPHTPFSEIDVNDFEKCLSVNTKGMMNCLRAEAGAMRKQEHKTFKGRSGERDIGSGSIVNIASANSYAGLPGKMVYTVSKHADIGLTRMLSIDHGKEGVRCNAICPTWVRTPLEDEELKHNPEVAGMIKAVSPVGRMAECEEVSDAIVFLLSPAASYINGASLMVDAGITNQLRMH